MKRSASFVDRVLRLYSHDWRDRYGEELRDLVDELAATGEFSRTKMEAGLILSALVQRLRSLRPSWRTVVRMGTVLALVAAGLIVLTGVGSGRRGEPSVAATKGTIPPSTTHGTFDTKKVPDFISVTSKGAVVGYVPKKYVVPSSPNTPANAVMGEIAPVYGPDLTTLVGHMYPGVGFVALGTSVQSFTCQPITMYGSFAGGSTTTSTFPCPSITETVPDVVGMFTPNGVGALQEAGVQAVVENGHSPSVPAGHIVRTSPAADAKVPARTPVVVINSLGP